MGRRYHYPKIHEVEGKVFFEDYKGDTSKLFISATKYENGFSQVKRKSMYERPSFRDLVGNITATKTQIGEDFYKFCKGEIKLSDLPAIHFACYPFYQAVLDAAWTRIEAAKERGKLTPQEANKKFMKVLQSCNDKRRAGKEQEKRNKNILQLF